MTCRAEADHLLRPQLQPRVGRQQPDALENPVRRRGVQVDEVHGELDAGSR
jgi:hypothetical protein